MSNGLVCDDGELRIEPSAGSSRHDFDFVVGSWDVHNFKLKSRLTGCAEWVEFDFDSSTRSILNGFGNLDESGNTMRLFDGKTRLWSISSGFPGAEALDFVYGSFEGPIGRFFGKDKHEGQDIICQFEWDRTDPDRPTWRQAFSVDDGKSWEWNWKMQFVRKPG